MPSGEEEYQRFLGFPASLFPGTPGRGRQRREGEHSSDSLAGLRHPITWIRWRIDVRRRGPFAPDFEEFRRRPQGEGQ